MTTIIHPKIIDCGKKGRLSFTAGQSVEIIKELNENQVVIENSRGERASYLKQHLKTDIIYAIT